MMVWHYFHAWNDTQHQIEIVSALAESGIQSVPLAQKSPKCTGIVFFGEHTQELCELLRTVSRRGNDRVLAVSVGNASHQRGIWALLEAGACDVVCWDHREQRLQEIILRLNRWNEIDEILESPLVTNNLVGKSLVWKTALRQLIEVALFTDTSVLISGESGSGKELAARLIHSLDKREQKRDLVVLDCTTIVPTLSGSEFFGHERGAFTGASCSRDGAFALADGGTLFLDEVGELPLELQAQLLRVVQEKCYKRVGGNSWQKTEFRLVCATNRDLMEETKRGRFRHDLYYRIAGWECRLPSLRDRNEDIIPLARHFMSLLTPHEKPLVLEKQVEEYLLKREYPGNVRDLKQLITRIIHRHVGRGSVTVGDIPIEERPAIDPVSCHWCDEPFEQSIRKAVTIGVGLKEIGRIAEDTAVDIAVQAEEGNLQRAAQRLGVTDRALQLRRANRRQNGLSA
jgi:transcriptional regulator with GAF, ATPase, and Fis domain